MAAKWMVKGDALGACSCDWGCPCNFDAPPAKGWYQSGYSFHINKGNFNPGDDREPCLGRQERFHAEDDGWLAHRLGRADEAGVTGPSLARTRATSPPPRSTVTSSALRVHAPGDEHRHRPARSWA